MSSEREASAQPGVKAQRQVGQARETILHVSWLWANHVGEDVLHASSCLPLRSLHDYISRVTTNIC